MKMALLINFPLFGAILSKSSSSECQFYNDVWLARNQIPVSLFSIQFSTWNDSCNYRSLDRAANPEKKITDNLTGNFL
jgi:hypothetical protein